MLLHNSLGGVFEIQQEERVLQRTASFLRTGAESCGGVLCMQAFEGIAQILLAGTDSVMHAMEMYTKRAWVLRAWQDVFVDLVQGQLQQLFLSLLSREPRIHLPPIEQSLNSPSRTIKLLGLQYTSHTTACGFATRSKASAGMRHLDVAGSAL